MKASQLHSLTRSIWSTQTLFTSLLMLFSSLAFSQTTSVTALASPTVPTCGGKSFSITYAISGTFTAGNVFTAQLSDASGSFGTPVSIGSATSVTAGTITVTIPNTTVAGTSYKIRVIGSTPAGTPTASASFTIRETWANAGWTENMGTSSSTSNINTYETNDLYSVAANIYSTTAGAPVINSSNSSGGYTGASGGNSISFAQSNGANFIVGPINTSALEKLGLSFGIYKSTSAATNANFILEYATASSFASPTAMTYTTLPTTSNGWYGVTTSTALPQNATLYLRWRATSTTILYRLDDIVFTAGTPTAVVISPNTSQSICSGSSVAFSTTSVTGANYAWSNAATTTSTSINTTSNAAVTTTDAFGCAAYRGPVAVTVNSYVTPSVSISATATTICPGASVTFTATPTNGGASPSYQWKVNGNNVGTNSATFVSNTCVNGDVITVVMTTNAPCSNSATATSSGITMVVSSTVTPAVSVSASATTICAGSNATFTATPTNGGASPTYQWKVNGVNAGTNSSVYTTAALTNADVVTVVMTSNATCPSPATATSTGITLAVQATVTPSVSVAASSTTICVGSSATFTATPTNGGTTPSYQWKVNGNNVGSNSATYSSSGLSNNDLVTVVMTSNATCASPSTATSSAITMSVTSYVTPQVNTSASATTFCAGTSVTVTATPTNGGTTPSYQWKVNGVNAGTNSATFTSTTLSNGDVVTVVLTSSALCPSPTTATSSGITMTVNPILTPSVTLAANTTSICTGNNVSFTPTATNGGSASYQWFVNGSNVASGSTYNSSTLTNGATVYCRLTSSAACANPTTANSNTLTITVTTNATPSVSISTTPTTICAGSNATFTATPTNGGSTPSYQWKVNGSNVGTNSATYSTTTLANGNTVTCTMTSSATCVTTPTANSNTVTMTVNPTVTPTIIATTSTTTVCSGATVNFTTSRTNAGTTPTYQWKVNGVNVGTSSSSYSTTTLANGDVVTVTMTSNAVCPSPASVTSAPITMTVNPSVTPSVTISGATTTTCSGTGIPMTATPVNGGTNPTYTWYYNGNTNMGTGNPFSTLGLINGATYTCVMTSNALCATPSSVTSNPFTQIIVSTNITPTLSISASSNPICLGSPVTFTPNSYGGGLTPTYTWKKNGSVVATGDTYTSSTLVAGNVISCVMTTSLTCVTAPTATSNGITISVTPSVTSSVSLAASATTICSGSTVNFTATPTNGGTTPAYQWTVNGANTGTNSATFSSNTLANGDVIRVILTSSACASPATATSNAITMVVNSNITPSITISTPATTVCANTNTVFTATPINGGSAPTYQWMIDGVNVGSSYSSYTATSLANGSTVTCGLTSSASCTTTPTATSQTITMTVTPSVTPTVSITASTNDVCAGTSITFVPTPTNGGSSATYQWYKNGTLITSGSTYTTTSCSNNDAMTCVMTSSATCASPTTATSNGVTMIIHPIVAPTVSISASTTNSCTGNIVTFTPTPTNGGSAPTYQWKKNGSNVTTGAAYSSSSLANGDVISCVLTSDEVCLTTTTATSNSVTMTVTTTSTPTVSISTPATSICGGTNAVFTASIANGGTSPSYQWKKNGTNVSTSASYTASGLVSGDAIACVLTSNAACVTAATATSNSVSMTVTPLTTPSVSIVGSTNGICAGTSVSFTATPTNGGTTPTYQWRKNGSNVGTNATTYADAALAQSDVITCVMTNNITCPSSQTSTSNSVIMTVHPIANPAVVVTATSQTICTGGSVTFTATPTGGGTPGYSWYKNTSVVGTNSATYTTSGLTQGDVIACVMTSTALCRTSNSATSNTIVVSVNGSTSVSVVSANVAAMESDGTANIVLGITNPSSTQATTVDLVLSSGDATRINNYTTQQVTFPAGSSSNQTVSISINNNASCDDIAALHFSVQNIAGGNCSASIGAASTVALTITDDEMDYPTILSENFEAGIPSTWTTSTSNTWVASPTAPLSGSRSLRSVSSATAGSSYISTYYTNGQNFTNIGSTWQFNINHFGNEPTPTDKFVVFLVADRADLNSSSINGYAVGINPATASEPDLLSLYKVESGQYNAIISSSLDWGTANGKTGIQVIRSREGEWTLNVDSNGDFNTLTSQGTGNDLTMEVARYFGVYYNYTAATSSSLSVDDMSFIQSACRETYYSAATGNSDGSIWSPVIGGTGETIAPSRFSKLVIRSGHNVTLNNSIVVQNLTVNTGGTLNLGSNEITLYGNLTNQGTINPGSGKVTLRGDTASTITGPVTLFNVEVDNSYSSQSASAVTLTGVLSLKGVLDLTRGTLQTNGNLKVISNAAGTGSIGPISDNADIIGNVTLQRYMPQALQGWVNLGNSIPGLTLQAWNDNLITTGFPGSDYPPPGYNWINLYTYNETLPGDRNTGWVPVTNITNTLQHQTGYMLYMTAAANMVDVTGNIQKRELSIPLSYTNTGSIGDGYNLMTNPYPSEIDWDQVVAASPGLSTFYVYDTQLPGYRAYNGLLHGGTGSRYIPSGQSFFTGIDGPNRALNFTEPMKSNNGTLFERELSFNNTPHVNFRFEKDGLADECQLGLNSNASAQFDPLFDGFKMYPPVDLAPAIALLTPDSVKLTLDYRPQPGHLTSIPVHVDCPTDGAYTFNVTEMVGLNEGVCYTIRDIVTNQRVRMEPGATMTINLRDAFHGVRFMIESSIVAQVTESPTSCYASDDGVIAVLLSQPGTTFELYNAMGKRVLRGSQTQIWTEAPAGRYDLMLSNTNSACGTMELNVQITEPDPFMYSTDFTVDDCDETSNGTIQMLPLTKLPFSYKLTNAKGEMVAWGKQNDNLFWENLPADKYTLKVETACETYEEEFDLRDPNAIHYDFSVSMLKDADNHSKINVFMGPINATDWTWTLNDVAYHNYSMLGLDFVEGGENTAVLTATNGYCSTVVTRRAIAAATEEDSLVFQVNSTNEYIQIRTKQHTDQRADVRLLDMTGKQVFQESNADFSAGFIQVPWKQLAAGMYIVQLTTKNSVLLNQQVVK